MSQAGTEDRVNVILIMEPGSESAQKREPVKSSKSSDFVFYSPGTFPADFELACAPGYQPTQAEQAYLDRLRACIASLEPVSIPDSAKADTDLRRRKEANRDDAFRKIRQGAEEFARLPRGDERDKKAAIALCDTYRIIGGYQESEDRYNKIPFTVTALSWSDKPDRYYDIKISTRDNRIPDDKAHLKVEIDAATAVTRTVFDERLSEQNPARSNSIQMRLHEYMAQLRGIAAVGLTNMDPTQAAFAKEDLARFRREFVAREAGTVKNRYLRRLGIQCLLVGLPITVGYGVAHEATQGGLLEIARDYFPFPILHGFRNFFLLALGTAIGTWLSFSLRRVTLTFDDLAVLEEDRLDPSLRVLFMIGLTIVLGLLFWTGAANIVVGELDGLTILKSGAGAMLIGLLAGIAERTLGTAISRRATDFTASLSRGSSGSSGSNSSNSSSSDSVPASRAAS